MPTSVLSNDSSTRSDPRPDYIHAGIDAGGAHHVFRTTDETVHVVRDGVRERVERLDDHPNKDINDWLAFVTDSRGWADQRLFETMADAMTARIEVSE